MFTQFSRTELVFGKEGVALLKQKSVAVLGAGGVGSFTMEALARTGIGRLILIDKDVVDITNVNRQIPALVTTVGRPKVDVMKERIAQINPDCEVIALQTFFLEDTKEQLFAHKLDYVADAIDIISAKILLVRECVARGIPVVSSMGAANKIDPTRFRIMDLSETRVDPIAKVMRHELKRYGISHGVKTVCSTESPRQPHADVLRDLVLAQAPGTTTTRKAQQPPASIAYVPSVAGLILASAIIHDLLGIDPAQ